MMLSRFGWVMLCPLFLVAQDSQDLALGKALFRGNCAFCHGLTGRGGRGPSLVSGHFNHGSSDEDLKRIIKNGIPGTGMPGFGFADDELDPLLHFLRGLAGSGARHESVAGDPARGLAVYQRSGCAGCHQIGNQGSVYGPELTRIGAARAVEYIRQSLTDPSADVPEDYEGVAVVTRDGRRVSGIRLNEDTFTVQLRDASQEFRLFRKDEVKEVVHQQRSLMPAYRSLPAADLQDLLAYLVSLKGPAAGGEVKKAEGIR